MAVTHSTVTLVLTLLGGSLLVSSIPSLAQEAGSKDQIVLAIQGEPDEGFDPTLGWGRYGSPLFQSTLLKRDEDLNIVNDLAESWEVNEDGTLWTVKIREDVTFTDGEDLTAEDVAYTFNTAATQGGIVDLSGFEEAVAVGPYEVELRLDEPRSTFVNRLLTVGIVPEHVHGEDYARNPVGSGPYTFVQWQEGQQLIVAANPDYYGGEPAIQRLVFLFAEEDTAFAAARAGQAQVVSVPQALAIQEIEGMGLYDVDSVDNRGIMFPFLPDTGEQSEEGYPIGNDVTADPAIRQAINYALDRQVLVEGILEGYGSPAYGPVSGLPWEEPEATINDGDLERAQEILADGGWEDTEGDGILDMLQPLGIQMNAEGRSWDEIQTLMHSNAVVFGWGSHDPTEVYNLYHSSLAGVDFFNAGHYENAEIDELLELALGAPTEEEAIVYWRAAQWNGEQGFTTKGDAAWAWLVNLDHTYFVDECLDIGPPQVQPPGHGWPITANIASWTWTCEN